MLMNAMSPAAPFHAPPPSPPPFPSSEGRARSAWPQARLDALRGLYDEGLSHLLIAQRLAVSKGLISAKIARMGWRRGTVAPPVQVAPRVRPALVIDPARLRRLEHLGPRDCHWPVAEDGQGVQLFCGCRRGEGVVYCKGHLARAFRRPKGWEEQAVALSSGRRPAAWETPGREKLGWDRFGNL